MKKSLELYIKMEISRDGKVIKKYRKRKCRSFVKQFVQSIFSELVCKPVVFRDFYGSYRSAGTAGMLMGMLDGGGPYVGKGVPVSYVSPAPPYGGYMTSNTVPSPFVASASSVEDYQPENHQPWRAFRVPDASTYGWQADDTTSGWLKIDVGAGNEKIATSFTITTFYYYDAPINFYFQGSNNDSTWTDLYASAGSIWNTGVTNESKTFTCSVATTAYRYFRLNVGNTQGHNVLRINYLTIYSNPLTEVYPLSVDNYCMGNTNTGLSYSGTTFAGPYTSVEGTQFMVTRVLTNNTASSITINETGLLAYHNYYFLLARDLLDPVVTVSPTETLTLTYILATTV